jgi:hypothetical protein
MTINWTKKEDASESILTAMIWAIFSLLLVRIYLRLTGYPQIGHGAWHISHALFGGMIMTAGTMINLIMQGRGVKKISVAIFGFGLGWFIDEVGKYLTRDYNYFFRPAIIVIYIFFVIMFLIYRYLEKKEVKSNEAIFYSVLSNLEEVVDDDLEKREKRMIVKKLETVIESGKGNLKLMAVGLLATVKKMTVKEDGENINIAGWARKIFNLSYDRIFKRTAAVYGLLIYAVYFSVDKIVDILRIGASSQKMMMIQKFYEDYDFFGKSDVYMIVFKMIFDVVASVLFLTGVRYFLTGKRIKGARFFRYGLYVTIFLVSIFKFYFEQFSGLYEVIIAITLLYVLNRYQRDGVIR